MALDLTIGRPIATAIFGGFMLTQTEKGVFWWDETRWRKLCPRPEAPANEGTTAEALAEQPRVKHRADAPEDCGG